MIDSLLGVELPLPVKLIVAFVIVLVLIALATWVFRRLGGDRAGPSASRGRQPRLAVIDAASVDGRRRLVLVRRDNVEHLIMIGGPADVVIEQNIVRAVPVAPPREAPGHRMPPEPPMRGAPEPMTHRAPPESYRAPPPPEPVAVQRTRLEPMPRQTTELPRSLRPPAAARRSEPDPPPVEVHPAPPTADPNLADMATKLEAALRRPTPPKHGEATAEVAAAPAVQKGAAAPPAPAVEPTAPPVRPPAPEATSAPKADSKPAAASANAPAGAPGKSVFDSLEEEMASLLGRPPGKP